MDGIPILNHTEVKHQMDQIYLLNHMEVKR